MEEWRDIDDYPGYQVSNIGNVRSFKNNRHGLSATPHPIKRELNSKGYYRVTIGGRNNRVLVHKLVAETFIPNPNNYPVVRHGDDDRKNNSVDNLSWGTQSDNIQDAIRRGRFVSNIKVAKEVALEKQRKPVIASTVDGCHSKTYPSLCAAARDLNLNEGCISNVLHGRQKKTGGYIFVYSNKEEG